MMLIRMMLARTTPFIRRRFSVAAMLVPSLGVVAQAQGIPVVWKVRVEGRSVVQGQPFVALVRAQIPYSWHVYSATQPPGGSMATTIVANSKDFRVSGAISARVPDKDVDKLTGIDNETYADSVTFRVPVTALRSGRQAMELKVTFQSCTNTFCTPPKTEIVKTTVVAMAAQTKR